MGNGVIGFIAITYLAFSLDNFPDLRVIERSAWLILIAMIFDACDGFVARLLNAVSPIGKQLDSLADMVSFGLAPSFLVAIIMHFNPSRLPHHIFFIWLITSIYFGSAAFRLAVYNVTDKKDKDDSRFSGLPTPGAAAVIIATVIFFIRLHGQLNTLSNVLLVITPILGILMISKIPYHHIVKIMTRNINKKAILLAGIIFLITITVCTILTLLLIISPFWIYAMFLGVTGLYLISGIIFYIYQSSSRKNKLI